MNLYTDINLEKLDNYEQKIPKQIIQTSFSNEITNVYHLNSIYSFQELNPEYKYLADFEFNVLINDDGEIWEGTQSVTYYPEGGKNENNMDENDEEQKKDERDGGATNSSADNSSGANGGEWQVAPNQSPDEHPGSDKNEDMNRQSEKNNLRKKLFPNLSFAFQNVLICG